MSERDVYGHLYKSALWRKMRLRWLRKHPMCQCPHCKGSGLPAAVVHHKQPHKGDRRKFFDSRNLTSMAKVCHDRFQQSEERGGIGFLGACDEKGWPLDPSHHWNKEGSE